MWHFWDKSVCFDCVCEYRKMFFGYKNRDARRFQEHLENLKKAKGEENFNGVSEDS